MDRQQQRKTFLGSIVLPVAAAVLATAAIVAVLLFWSTREADAVAVERQRALFSFVLHQSVLTIAHDQEASTVWDDAIKQVRASKPDLDWIDSNLGVWFHSYYGHDETYVLDNRDRPIYAMQNGRRVDAGRYRQVAAPIRPLLADLRWQLKDGVAPAHADMMLSNGAADLIAVDGRPSIVSVKPIVSDTGKIPQIPEAIFLHVSVRHLNGNFLSQLASRYDFGGARFVWTDRKPAGPAVLPLRNNAGHAIGYVTWNPFAPGSIVGSRMVPALGIAALLVVAIVAVLMLRVRRGALQLEASRAQAQHLAFHDTLTGLPNRALFNDQLDYELAGVRRDNHTIALLYLDIDRFKHVNDTLGHPAGDELIRRLGHRLSETVGHTGMVARLGGDEFAIIQTAVASTAEVEALCDRIVEIVNQPFELVGNLVHVGVSVGVALSPADAADRIELSRKADIALYHAKECGRGRSIFFADGMDASIRIRESIERDLRIALAAGNQLEVLYQPLYAAQSRKMTGVEALVQWQHPCNGRMVPATFIPIAEETGLIEPLGEWVLEQACREAVRWTLETVSVNVSPVQLRNLAFASRVLAILGKTGLDPRRLELEITETCFIENAAQCQPNLAALRAKGVRIALDDFGTGYSSLNHLRQFTVDRVKIDGSFVQGIDLATGGSPIIQAIVDLARASGLKVTAEGVETMEQSQFLSGIGCHELQGFLLSRPIQAAQISEMLKAIERPVSNAERRRHSA